MATALPSPAVQPRRHPSSFTDTNPAAKLSCRTCETTLVFLGEANGGYEDIFWNIQIVRTFSLNVLAIAGNLPKRFRDFSNKKTDAITLSGIPDHISPSRTALPNMNTMKFVVVVLFALIGSASAAVSQADCATLSAFLRCPPRPIVTPPFVNGAGVLAPQAMQP